MFNLLACVIATTLSLRSTHEVTFASDNETSWFHISIKLKPQFVSRVALSSKHDSGFDLGLVFVWDPWPSCVARD